MSSEDIDFAMAVSRYNKIGEDAELLAMACEDRDASKQIQLSAAFDDLAERESCAHGAIKFGRHKGSTLAIVLQKDPSYIRWAANNADMFNGPLHKLGIFAVNLRKAAMCMAARLDPLKKNALE